MRRGNSHFLHKSIVDFGVSILNLGNQNSESTYFIGIAAARIVAVRFVTLLSRHRRAAPAFCIVLSRRNRIIFSRASIDTEAIEVLGILSPELDFELASTIRFN